LGGGGTQWPDLGEAGQSALCGLQFAGGIYCSAEDTCRALDCGQPWSLYDEHGCARQECTSTGECPTGLRCVPAPVGGEFTRSCFQGYDSCDTASGACQCYQYLECGSRAVCLSESAFPPDHDCPIAGLDCAELRQAAATVRDYLDQVDSLEFVVQPAQLTSMVDTCEQKIQQALSACGP
jgi:hypothetical protein